MRQSSVMPAAESNDRKALRRALTDLQARGSTRMAQVRFAGAASFFALAAFLGYVQDRVDWSAYVPLLAAYTLLAALLLAAQRSGASPLVNAFAIPFVDVPAIAALQLKSLPLSPFPAGVAGWSLGLFVMFIVLAAVTFRRRVIYTTTATGWLAEGILQRTAQVGWGAVVSSGVVLVLTAVVTAWAARQLEGLVERVVSEETARRRAIEHNEGLRAANETIAQMNRELIEAQREAQMLSGMLIHDMKGPLTSMLLILQRLVGEIAAMPGSEGTVARLRLASDAGERLLGMIGDLLNIPRLEQGAVALSRHACSMGGLVDQVIRTHGTRASAEGISLSQSVDRALGGSIDRELVWRLLDNLVSNALRFVTAGQRIDISCEASANDVILRVRNNGPVIPPELRAQLFTKFSQHGHKRGFHNVGLGLYFCRLVAEAHGGTILCEDDPAWPVSFAVRFPAAAVSAQDAADAAHAEVAAVKSSRGA